jgi:hypothetical protein
VGSNALRSKTARACATVFIEFMIVIKERYDRWPVPKTTLRVDNGTEYGPQFEAAITVVADAGAAGGVAAPLAQ